MTSSKFPLYLTGEEWQVLVTMYAEHEIEYQIQQKLKDQLEKLGVKP